MGYLPGGRPGASITTKLENSWSNFNLWAKANGKTVHLQGFTKTNFHYTTRATFPFVGCKFADTLVFLKWIEFVAGLNMGLCLLYTSDAADEL